VGDAWWRDAVVYEIYVRSFTDSDGDGVGDLEGIRSRLPYLADLGVDAVWLTPFYPSPMHDHGYDVANYCDVEPTFGTLATFDALLADAHALGLRVFIDIVPNHTSTEHAWFREALADRSSPRRSCYLFRPPGADGGPPNDWQSVFGGPAWTLDEASGEYYLHLFDSSQPDLDWRNPAVHEEFRRILRFWLDRGVDGFRIDVAHAVMKDPMLRDGDENAWDQDAVFAVWEEWRALIDTYDDRTFVGEVFLYDMDRVAQYVGAHRLQQAFNFTVARAPYEAAALRDVLRRAVELFDRPDTSPTWVLSNHDLIRHATRFGGGAVGRRRARAATALMLALPGSPYLYQGEELGLEESDVPPADRQDPIWFRSGKPGRDGCRTPFPWTPEPPGHGFTTAARSWLPFDHQAAERNVDTETADADSTLSFYRRALAARRALMPELAEPARADAVSWPGVPDDVVAFTRPLRAGGELLVVANAGSVTATVELPADATVLLTSGGAAAVDGGVLALPSDTAVWLRTGTSAG
jgi:alpha-glucosidase